MSDGHVPRWCSLLAFVVAVLVAGATGCADRGQPATTDITVFAASSLTEAFSELGEAFTTANPDVSLTLAFGSSSQLAAQIEQGAPADVFASADEASMARLVDGTGTRGEPAVFASNRLQIIVAPTNPLRIAGLADLADPDVVFVTAAAEVPIGAYTAEVFDAAGVSVTPRSLEENVKAIVAKVALGEADAGIVYVSDVLAAGNDVAGVEIPAEHNVVANYPIAVPTTALHPGEAAAFVAFVLSAEGQRIVQSYGFDAP